MIKGTITFKGDKKVWFDFTNEVRKQKKTVWEIIAPMLMNYMFSVGTLEDKKKWLKGDILNPDDIIYKDLRHPNKKKQGEI